MINAILGVSNFGDLIKLIADNCPGWLSALIATLATTGFGGFVASVVMLVRNKIKVDSVLGSFNKAIDRVDNKLKENESSTNNAIAEFSKIINKYSNDNALMAEILIILASKAGMTSTELLDAVSKYKEMESCDVSKAEALETKIKNDLDKAQEQEALEAAKKEEKTEAINEDLDNIINIKI